MQHRRFISGLIFSCLWLVMPIAQSASIFSFGSEVAGLSTIVKTVDGISMTMSNPTPGPFDADGDGFFIDNGIEPVQNFDLVFDISVTLDSFNVGFADGPVGATWDIVGSNGSSLANLSAMGLNLFNGSLTLLAGEVYSVAANFTTTDDQYFQINEITVSLAPDVGEGTSTPEPGSILLLLVGLAVVRRLG